MNELIQFERIEEKIISIQGQQVILDSDVAALYGVETREINQAIKNNPDKFPPGYIIQLNKEEWANLKSKNLISSWGGKNKLPNVFAEKGLYMLATILKSPQAAQTTIGIVETFAKIRELSRNIEVLSTIPEEPQQRTLLQRSGEIMADILSGNSMQTTDTETSMELNLALLKVKHIVRRKITP